MPRIRLPVDLRVLAAMSGFYIVLRFVLDYPTILIFTLLVSTTSRLETYTYQIQGDYSITMALSSAWIHGPIFLATSGSTTIPTLPCDISG